MTKILNILILVLFIIGCSSEADQLKKSILSYNNLLMEGYSQSDLSRLETVTNPEQTTKLHSHIAMLNKGNMKLDALLKNIKFSRINITSPEMADAVTSESWDFRYTNLKSEKVVKELSEDYNVRYSLIKQEGKWLITSVEMRPEDSAVAASETPFLKHPADILSMINIPPIRIEINTEQILQNTVAAYNRLLAEGYMNQDMNSLAHSATKRRAMRAYHHMASLGLAQVKMAPRLQEIEFASVSIISKDKAEVETMENWVYAYYSSQTGEKVYENNVSYQLTYKLVKHSDRWFVDDININKSDEGPSIGELPFFVRPHDRPTESESDRKKVEGS